MVIEGDMDAVSVVYTMANYSTSPWPDARIEEPNKANYVKEGGGKCNNVLLFLPPLFSSSSVRQ